MIRLVSIVVALVATLSVALPAAHAAGGWQLGAQGDDASKSGDFVSIDVATTVNGVRAWTLTSTWSGPADNADVRVSCKRGSSNAERNVKLPMVPGTHTYKLPLPIVGGRCSVDVSVFAYATQYPATSISAKLVVRFRR